MEKTLILRDDIKGIFFDKLQKYNVQPYYNCKLNNIVFRICRKFNLPIMILLFSKWKKQINEYERIIFFDTGYTSYVSKYIKKKNKDIKTILWFWNNIDNNNMKHIYDKNIDEVWTYSQKEAEKYGLKYNTQFYTYKIKEDINREEIEYDVIFLGRAKSRKNELMKLESNLKQKGVKTKFMITENEKSRISYKEYLSLIAKSKCIIDYVQEGQTGLTLRPLEAMFFEKKLITNNKDIINYNFYNPNNIFVLGKDDLGNVMEFLEKKYTELDKSIVDYYDFEQWVKRFYV